MNSLIKNCIALFYIIMSISSGYTQVDQFRVEVKKVVDLPELPSASGVEILNNEIFIVGDDSPYLHKLGPDYTALEKIEIFNSDLTTDNRLPKPIKPDYEAIMKINRNSQNTLLVFSSGTLYDKRDWIVKVDLNDKTASVNTYKSNNFHNKLAENNATRKTLNIEGAAYWNDKILLLNRAENSMFKIVLESFMDYLNDKQKIPEFSVKHYELPELEGVQARFSGACMFPGKDWLIFSASVENTATWVNNGEILGSYIGIIDLKQPHNTNPVCELIMYNGNTFQEKLESVIVIHEDNNSFQMIGVIDNDDGTSKLVELKLHFY